MSRNAEFKQTKRPERGPNAEYAYADFFKARISNANTRKAYKHAVNRFLHCCKANNVVFRQITSFLIGDYLEHHLLDQDGHPLAAPAKSSTWRLSAISSPTSSSITALVSTPQPLLRLTPSSPAAAQSDFYPRSDGGPQFAAAAGKVFDHILNSGRSVIRPDTAPCRLPNEPRPHSPSKAGIVPSPGRCHDARRNPA